MKYRIVEECRKGVTRYYIEKFVLYNTGLGWLGISPTEKWERVDEYDPLSGLLPLWFWSVEAAEDHINELNQKDYKKIVKYKEI